MEFLKEIAKVLGADAAGAFRVQYAVVDGKGGYFQNVKPVQRDRVHRDDLFRSLPPQPRLTAAIASALPVMRQPFSVFCDCKSAISP